MRRLSKSFVLLVGILLFTHQAASGEIKISGNTMGTTYHITVIDRNNHETPETLQAMVDGELDKVNKSMSMFISDSEISRFNQFREIGKPFPISQGFLYVMNTGKTVYAASKGTWDGTVKPLVDLWGFGVTPQEDVVPSEAAISRVLKTVGFNQINISDNGYLVKKNPEITLDLSSIAKGYGVDHVAETLKKRNYCDFLVEIGGEVYCSGVKEDRSTWRVGVNTPKEDAPLDAVYSILGLDNAALATSGDYRNFFNKDGKHYSHIIDPKSGYPIQNNVVSASVIASNCTLADGLATALMAMGETKGMEMVNGMDGVECLIITHNGQGKLENHYSKGFKKFEISMEN